MSHILHVSGGSAGHLAPLVAVVHALYECNPNTLQSFMCSDANGDEEFARKEGLDPIVLPRPQRNFMAPLIMYKIYKKSLSMMKSTKPDIVFSKGGLISVPVCYAAKRLHIPIVLHESDAVMGRANKLVARWATVICMGFEPTSTKLTTQNSKLIVTGNPLRPHIHTGTRGQGLKVTGFSGNKPILLVIGGSQGAEALNKFVVKHIDQIQEHYDVIHLTGKGKHGASARKGYWSTEFASGDLPHLYACATVALSRGGAGSISECAANGLPMIIVPIEGLAHNHQVENAQLAEEKGFATVIKQADMEKEILPTLQRLIDNPELVQTMEEKAVTFQSTEASLRIAKILLETLAKKTPSH